MAAQHKFAICPPSSVLHTGITIAALFMNSQKMSTSSDIAEDITPESWYPRKRAIQGSCQRSQKSAASKDDADTSESHIIATKSASRCIMRDLADASASAISSLSSLDEDDGAGAGLTCGAHIDRTLGIIVLASARRP